MYKTIVFISNQEILLNLYTINDFTLTSETKSVLIYLFIVGLKFLANGIVVNLTGIPKINLLMISLML